jgi:predicted NAD/FAD-dependent oxidoreductase
MGAIIIGAGITGLTIAKILSRRSVKCTILEKSKSVGGRMATRYIDTDNGRVDFDHGCSSFMFSSKLVLPCAMKMVDNRRILFKIECLTISVLDIESEAHKIFKASSGMNSIPKSVQKQIQLNNNVEFQFNTKVSIYYRYSF